MSVSKSSRSRRTCGLAATAIILSATTAPAYQAEPVAHPGKIVGTIRYQGKPVKPIPLEVSKDRDACGAHPLFDQSLIVGSGGGIANAVITLPAIAQGAPLKFEDVKFDQKGCEYVPHVAAFLAGSNIEVLNSDGILHSVHTESVINPVIDMAQPGFKKVIRLKIDQPEAIKVTCDAHNWMEGWWYVTANPYYAISDAQGHYTIGGVPPGTYELRVWQEKLGVRTRSIKIAPDATVTADFALRSKPE